MNQDLSAEQPLSFSFFERIVLSGMLLFIVSILFIAARNGALLISGHTAHGGPLETIANILISAFSKL